MLRLVPFIPNGQLVLFQVVFHTGYGQGRNDE
jgi:hypothetical protein